MITYKNETTKTLLLERSTTPASSIELRSGDTFGSTLYYISYTYDGTLSVLYEPVNGVTVKVTRHDGSQVTDDGGVDTFVANELDYVEQTVGGNFKGTPEEGVTAAVLTRSGEDANDSRYASMESFNPIVDPIKHPNLTTIYVYVQAADEGQLHYAVGSKGSVKTKKIFHSDDEVGDPARKYVYYYDDAANPTKPTVIIEKPDVVEQGDIIV